MSNVGYTPGTGALVAADLVGGNLVQQVKMTVGAADTATVLTFGAAASAQSLPVVIASDQAPVGVTVADGSDVAMGAKADAAYAGTGSASVIAALKGVYTLLGAPLPAGANALGAVITTGNVPAGAADSGNGVKISGVFNTTPPTLTSGWRGDLQVDSTGSLIIAGKGTQLLGSSADAISTNSGYGMVSTQAFGRVYNGASWDRVRGDVNGQVNQPHAITGSRWQYAGPTGGIVNSATAVAIAAAAGASVRNYLTGLQVTSDALGVATEVVILDGATVIWRGKLQTAATAGWSITFPVPLKGTANTSMSVQTVTATVTGGVYVSAQGFTAT